MKKYLALLIVCLMFFTSCSNTNPKVEYDPLTDFEIKDTSFYPNYTYTKDNYPKIGFTNYTEFFTKNLFTTTFVSEDQSKPITSHRLNSGNPKTEKDLEKDLLSGNLDFAFIEKSLIDDNFNSDLEYTSIGQDALVFTTSCENPITSISSNDLEKILVSGDITKWSELSNNNGTDGKIYVSGKHAFNNANELISSVYLNSNSVKNEISADDYSNLVGETGDLSTLLGRFHNEKDFVLDYSSMVNLLGYTTVNFEIEDYIHVLNIDGISPLKSSKINEDYPLAFNYYLVTKKGAVSENVKPIIDYLTNENHDSQYFKMMFGGAVLTDFPENEYIEALNKILVD